MMMGEKLQRRPSEEELKRIAYHEVGHALIGEYVQPGSVVAVSISSRDKPGYTRQAPVDDRYLYTREEILGQIAICLSGAVAEELAVGSRSTGAMGDLSEAIELAKQMVLAAYPI